jgi:hypothetical protein
MPTPIANLPYPTAANIPNVPQDIQNLATALEPLIVPTFASLAAAEAAISAPIPGQLVNVSGTMYSYQTGGTGVWIPILAKRSMTMWKVPSFQLTAGTWTEVQWTAQQGTDSGIISGSNFTINITASGVWRLTGWWAPTSSNGACMMGIVGTFAGVTVGTTSLPMNIGQPLTGGNIMFCGTIVLPASQGDSFGVYLHSTNAQASTVAYGVSSLGFSVEQVA